MSKVRFKRVFICACVSDRKAILETLQRLGLVEIHNGIIDDEDLHTLDVSAQRGRWVHYSSIAEQALSVLDEYAPENRGLLDSLGGTNEIGKARYETKVKEDIDNILNTASKIVDLNKQIIELNASVNRARTSIDSLGVWADLDIPLSLEGTEKTRIFTGSIAEEADASSLYEKLSKTFEGEVPDMEIRVLYSSRTLTAFNLISHRLDADDVENALRSIGYTMAPLSDMVPTEEIKALEKEISGEEEKIKVLEATLSGFASSREDLRFAQDYFSMRADKYDVLQTIPHSKSVFFINGYTPEETLETLKSRLESLGALVEVTDLDPDEYTPSELKNNTLVEPMETVVEAYSYPNPSEIDPSPVVACFYYIMFGMMLSDAGYGILLALGCGYVLFKVRNLKPGLKKMMKLMFYSGITTTFWGFMFGSFFGDAVNVIASTFFGRPDIALNPIWFNPQTEPMRLLVVAFAIGIVHLFTGLGIKFYELVKAGQIKDAVYDVVFWYMFIGGAIVLLLSMDMITSMLSLDFTLGAAAGNLAKWITIIGAIGVILTGGRENKNWGVRLASGLYSAYGCTSWLSDILSYSRLLALGLATGVIAQVFNKMGSMVAGAVPLPIGIVLFAAIFCVGHVLNLAINLLGAYVHTNRLQFVEFFGKFYDGGGKPFNPFTENTKYYTIKEEI